MAADAVRNGIQQNRPAAFCKNLLLAPERIDHRQRIVAVDTLGVHLVAIHARADAGDELHAHGFAERLTAHAVKIVHAIEYDGQPAAERFVPEFAVLIHGRKGDALPHRTAAEGSIADIRHDDAGPAIDSLEQRCARRDGTGAAHDGVVGIDSEGGEERVHGAAQPTIETGFAGEDLAVRAIHEEANGQALHRAAESFFDGSENGAIPVGFHDVQQLRVAQLADGGQSLGKDLAVTAMRSKDMVVGSKRERHAYGRGLLADREVGGAGVIVGEAFVCAFGFDLVENGFEFPNRAHVLPHIQEVCSGISGKFFGDGLVVRIHRNVGEVDGFSGKDFFRFDDDGLRHSAWLLISLRVKLPQRSGGGR